MLAWNLSSWMQRLLGMLQCALSEAGLKLATRCIGTQLQFALSEAALKLATLYTGIFGCGSKQGSSDQCG